MEPSDFDLLLDRYVEDKLSEPERLKFEAWMDVMKVHKDTNLELSKKDQQEIYQRIISSMTTPEDILKFTPQLIQPHVEASKIIETPTPPSFPYLRVAAAILLLVSATVALYNYSVNGSASTSHTEVITSIDSQKVILNDGTIIWLGKGAVLEYTAVADQQVRSVSLLGSALFEVAKDATHPFTISSGDMTVTVVGTSFSIHADADLIELNVLTGKVKMSSTADNRGIDVFPNESIIYSPQGKIDITPLQPDELASVIANTDYDMAFRNTPMAEVFSKIEKKFDVKIIVANAHINDCRITADFTDHSLVDTMTMLSDLLELEYGIKDTTVSVSGTGCI